MLVIAAALLAGGAAACGGGDDDAKSFDIETEDGNASIEVDGDEDSPSVKVETDEGTFTGGGAAEIPDSFPDDFPLPDDAKVLLSGSQKTDDGEATTVAFEVPGSPKDIWEFFLDALPDADYDVVQQTSGGDGDGFAGSIGFERDATNGAVIIGGAESDKTSVSVTIGTTN